MILYFYAFLSRQINLLCMLFRSLCGLLRFGAIMCLFVAIPSFAAPRLHCDNPKYDFGTVMGRDMITHEFKLTNIGDEPVVISTIKNCCGTQSSIIPMEILPGSNAVCTTIFTTRNRYGKQDKQILIASNDRTHPYFELKLTGTLLKPVDVSPRYLRLRDLVVDQEIHQTITATNVLDDSVTLDSVVSSVSGIDAKVVGGGVDAARAWTIQLRRTGLLPVGKLNGQIVLNFSSGSVRVPVMGIVKSVLQVVPEHIQLSARSDKRVERLVMLRSAEDREFEVSVVWVENALGTVEATRLAKGKWRLTVVVDPASIRSGAKVVAETTCLSQLRVEIPLLVN